MSEVTFANNSRVKGFQENGGSILLTVNNNWKVSIPKNGIKLRLYKGKVYLYDVTQSDSIKGAGVEKRVYEIIPTDIVLAPTDVEIPEEGFTATQLFELMNETISAVPDLSSLADALDEIKESVDASKVDVVAAVEAASAAIVAAL